MIEILLKSVKVVLPKENKPKKEKTKDHWGRDLFPVPIGTYTVKQILEIAPELKSSDRRVGIRVYNSNMITTVSASRLVAYNDKDIVIITDFT